MRLLRLSTGLGIVSEMRWDNGTISIAPEGSALISFAEGLHEIIGPREDARPRFTPVEHPEFLERVKDCIERQFPALLVEIEEVLDD